MTLTVETPADVAPEKMYRAVNLTYDRGWNRKMIAELTPDKTITKAKSSIRYYGEDQVLRIESKWKHEPVSKPRPPKKSPDEIKRRSGEAKKKKLVEDWDYHEASARKSLSNCPPDVQRRIIHLQSLVPFHTPLDLGRLAVAEYNEIAIRRKKPLISLGSSSRFTIDSVKLRYLERRIHEKLPTAHRIEMLKAIRIVYPYMAEQIDAYIASLYRRNNPSQSKLG